MKTLSAREIQVAELLAWGYSDKEIAEELFISFDTVRTHHKNIYRKLSLRNLSDITRWYFQDKGNFNFGIRPQVRFAVSVLFIMLAISIEYYNLTALRAKAFRARTARVSRVKRTRTTKNTYQYA